MNDERGRDLDRREDALARAERRQRIELPTLEAVAGQSITRREYEEIIHRQREERAARVIIEADVVRIDKGLVVVAHSIEGDGVAGLADDMKDMKIWRSSAAMAALVQNVQDLMAERSGRTMTGKEQVASRYRAILLAISIIGGLIGLSTIIVFLARLAGAIG